MDTWIMKNDEELIKISWNENVKFIATKSNIYEFWRYQAGEAYRSLNDQGTDQMDAMMKIENSWNPLATTADHYSISFIRILQPFPS